MTSPHPQGVSTARGSLSTRAFVAAIFLASVLMPIEFAQSQTFTVLHNFSNAGDGGYPFAGVTMDRAGNLYGTTSRGGETNNGAVYKLTQRNGAWFLNPVYNSFGLGTGTRPDGPVTVGSNGTLYGTTSEGGPGGGGTVFHLTPSPHAPSNIITPWTLTSLYDFGGGNDGASPTGVVLVFDAAGNIYGTTMYGGIGCEPEGCGTVFKLTPTAQGQWTETILYQFTGGNDGAWPMSGVIFDGAGNLYGTASNGGIGTTYCGTAFRLTPSGSGWVETTLYNFGQGSNDACQPAAGLTFDGAGNLFGTTSCGGPATNGTVFELTPQPGGSWTETVLYTLSGLNSACGGPNTGVVIDAAGDLITASSYSGSSGGEVFELTPSSGGWRYTELHAFEYSSDGAYPFGNLLLDGNGNIYGTTSEGGEFGAGTVWKITP